MAIRAVTAYVAAATLFLPFAAQALSIGDITLQSRLGEPLRAQVSLTTEGNERVDDSCLFLLPAPANEDGGGYLTNAYLSLKAEGTRQYISIVSRKPFNDAFARMRLEVRCPNMGLIIKTFTVLPDLGPSVPEPPLAAPAAPVENQSAIPAPDKHPAPPAADTKEAAPPVPAAKKPHANQTARARRKPQRSSARHAGKTPAEFRLKLSGDPIDESRIGKITPEERVALLAQRKLLDADDQMASFLALQNQVKLLQQELGEIKLQLAQLGPPPAMAASQVTAGAADIRTAPVTKPPERLPPPQAVAATKPPVAWEGNPYLQNGLFAAVGLLAVLLLLQGLRRYTKKKSRAATETQHETSPSLRLTPKTPEAVKADKPARSEVPAHVPKVAPPAETPPPPPPHEEIEEEISEEEAMLEEAKLYVTHGRPAKSVEILQEFIRRFPEKAEAWSLLLSIYSSLGKTSEFGQTARDFLQHHKDSPLWNGIQALGRTLDPDDPLYADQQGAAARLLAANLSGARRQVGDILMDMGALSEQDLQNCLADYEPTKHGRFGGYLVARKAITLAQLDQALLRQQGISPEMQEGDLPSLQDMENLLADFDPMRDGSVSDFLASRDAAASKELSTLLQRHSAPEEPTQPEIKPLFKDGETLDFVLESTSELPALDLEFEPADSASEAEVKKPLDFEIETAPPPPKPQSIPQNASLDFPEIQLNFSDELTGEQTDNKP